MVFKMEVDSYVKRKSMLEENIQQAYSLVLGKCIGLLKRKLKKSMGWSEAPIKFDVINLINIIESILLKFEDQKYLPISFH